ncbi:MAG: hypothetical protein IJ132_01595 [Firmicutes bacterium]|nr:hypothetical protein [Bacillota bacterium]
MRRLLSVFGVLALAFALTAVFSVPESAYASGTKAKPKVDGEVHYYDKKDESGATTGKGIDYFTLNPYTYYNICKDSGKLTKDQIRTIAEKHIFPRWGVIAEGMFRDQASQLVTIEGSGMMSSDKNASESFDRHFSYGKKGVNTGYSGYNWSVSDLADMLGHDKTSGKSSTDDLSDFKIIKGSTNNDEVVSCGIHPINNLNDARTMMGRSLRACADDNDLSVDDFLGNGKDKSGNEYRLPALADDKTGGGYVNIVTCNNRAGSSGDYDYVAFGIAVYDFDVTPIAAKGLNYITEADEYIDEDNPIKAAAQNAKPNSEISYNENGSGSITSLMENKSPQEATTTTTLENSATEENFISTEDEFEWGMEQEIGVEVQWGGDDAIGFAPSKVAVHANQGWHESWRTMTSKGETKSKTTSKSVSTEMPLPGHTGALVVQNTECKEWTLPYGQPVALSYKVAVFAMSGDYYNGWGGMISASRYDKEWMSVIFDGSDGTEPGGSNALASLHSRAVTNVDETS